MRACLATLLASSLALPSIAVSAPLTLPVAPMALPAAAVVLHVAPDAEKTPPELYEEGKKAYRLGKFAEAVQKWELAYDKSESPLLLYNISLAYKSLYDISGDVEDLRKARAVMSNFLVVAEAQEAEDAEERIAELDKMIADAKANAPKPEVEPGEPKDEPKPLTPTGPDPGRTLRIAGAGTMGGGGLLVVTGAVVGIFLGVKGQEFSDELRQLQSERDGICGGDEGSTACRQQDANIETARDNGRKANLGLGLSLGIGGGLGLVALTAGAILFVQGNRRTAEWKRPGVAKHQLRLVPTGRGLALSGRF